MIPDNLQHLKVDIWNLTYMATKTMNSHIYIMVEQLEFLETTRDRI